MIITRKVAIYEAGDKWYQTCVR